MALTLALSIIVPLLPVFKTPVAQKIDVPPRIAKLILEKHELRKPKPVATPKPKPEPVVKEIPPPKKKPVEQAKIVREPTPVNPPIDTTKRAREKARQTGLLAMSDTLSDLRNQVSTEQLKGSSRLTNSGSEAARTERSLITSKASGSSKGINTAALSRDTGNSQLTDRMTTEVQSPVDLSSANMPLQNDISRASGRNDEEIQIVFDRNKSSIYSLYNRELRRDPSLQGKIVIRLTIDSTGKVTDIEVISSELGLPRLEEKLIQRIKLFNFGPKSVDSVTVIYPIQFLPA